MDDYKKLALEKALASPGRIITDEMWNGLRESFEANEAYRETCGTGGRRVIDPSKPPYFDRHSHPSQGGSCD